VEAGHRARSRPETGNGGHIAKKRGAAGTEKMEVLEVNRTAGLVESGQKSILGTAGVEQDSLREVSDKPLGEEIALGSDLIAGTTQESESVLDFAFFGVPKVFDSSEWILLTVTLPKTEESR
jgi:hypothetical protein